MKTIVLVLALIGIAAGLFFLYKQKQSKAKTVEEEIQQTGKKLEEATKKTNEGLEKLGLNPEEVKEAAGIKNPCAYEPPCESDKFFLNADGCCELKPEKKLTAKQQKLEMAKSMTKTLVTEMVIGELVEGGIKLAAFGTKIASIELGKAGFKITGKAMGAVSKSLTKVSNALSSPGFLVFDIASALLDIFDPAGYNLYQSNSVQKNLRNMIEVQFEEAIKKEGMAYPMLYPLGLIPDFTDDMEVANSGLTSKFLPDVIKEIEKKEKDAFVRIVTSIQQGADMSDADSAIIGNGLVKFLENNPQKRDQAIYDSLQATLPKEQKKYVKLYKKLSTKDTQGITLSEEGVKWWDQKNQNAWLTGAKNAPPFIAMYTNKYRILDRKNPGKKPKSKPNTVEKTLPEKTALAFPFTDLLKNCEGTLQGGLIPGVKPKVKPYDYGVRFNTESGLCDMTSRWCTRMGLIHVKKPPTNCKSPPGAKIAEFFLGSTVTKGLTQVGATLSKSYGRGVGKIPKCKKGYEKKGLICYPKCKKGYKSSALECEGKCPKGTKNSGLTCINGTKAYLPKPKFG